MSQPILQSRSSAAAVRLRGDAGGFRRPSPVPAWVLLTGVLLLPASLQVHLAGEGFKITPGRASILLLLLPAFGKLFQRGRHFISSELFMLLTCAWMIGSQLPQSGLNASAVVEAIELGGGYLVARAYFFRRSELQEFMHVFKILTVVVILLSLLDTVSGTNVITELFIPGAWRQYRGGIVRAQSTIEDAEHFGTFCCVAGSLFLYAETTPLRKLLWTGFSFLGCILALSSGPLLAFLIVVASFFYAQSLKQYAWRWKAYQAIVALAVIAIYVFVPKPTSWIVSHLTLDPGTGYFRLYVFDYYYDMIAFKPIWGWGFADMIGDDEFLGKTTLDNVWLVCAVRFGIPIIVLLLMTNIGTFYRSAPRIEGGAADPYINSLGTGFTASIICFCIIGLTVHYWNAIWILWGVCLGVRAAIKESQVWPQANPARTRGSWHRQVRNVL